jgi:hypothetical protein
VPRYYFIAQSNQGSMVRETRDLPNYQALREYAGRSGLKLIWWQEHTPGMLPPDGWDSAPKRPAEIPHIRVARPSASPLSGSPDLLNRWIISKSRGYIKTRGQALAFLALSGLLLFATIQRLISNGTGGGFRSLTFLRHLDYHKQNALPE